MNFKEYRKIDNLSFEVTVGIQNRKENIRSIVDRYLVVKTAKDNEYMITDIIKGGDIFVDTQYIKDTFRCDPYIILNRIN